MVGYLAVSKEIGLSPVLFFLTAMQFYRTVIISRVVQHVITVYSCTSWCYSLKLYNLVLQCKVVHHGVTVYSCIAWCYSAEVYSNMLQFIQHVVTV